MNWLELLQGIFDLCIVPLLGLLTKFAIDAIHAYTTKKTIESTDVLQKKFLEVLNETITNCVLATNQTYVNELKNKNAFDAKAQKEAFQKTYQAVLSTLSDEAKLMLPEIIGDVEKYIVNKIESEVMHYKEDR